MIDVLGSANAGSNVTVNMKPTTRQGDYFARKLDVLNTSNPVYEAIRVSAVAQASASNGKDISTVKEGNVFVPKTPEAFEYDDDGNLTRDGRWHYTWDAENRLVGMVARVSVPAAAKLKLEFAYDYRGRRIEKKVYQWNAGTSAYEVNPSVTRFLYDGWNMVAELDGNNNVTRSYLWGLDLSGSQQGAGGVGGLLAMTDHTASPAKAYAYFYDGNGNVVDVIEDNIMTAAHYEYSPFGELITSTGSLAEKNPFQFSTKYTDSETGLLYYGYRYYNPSTGRWINRDPIGENGGENLYGMVGNDAVNLFDILGMKACKKVTIHIGGSPNGKTYIARTYPVRDGKAYEVPVYTLKLLDDSGKDSGTSWDALRFMPYLNPAGAVKAYKTVADTPFMTGLKDSRNLPSPEYKGLYDTINMESPEANAGAIVIQGTHYIHNGPSSLSGNPGWGSAGCVEVVGFDSLKAKIRDLSGCKGSEIEALQGLVKKKLLIIKMDAASRPPVKEAPIPDGKTTTEWIDL